MSQKQRQLLIAKLLGDLTLTNAQRAEIAQCSKRTVERVQRKLLEAVGQDEPVIKQYQTLLDVSLPIQTCVDELAWLATQRLHLPSKAAALKRVEQLRGIVTLKEAKKLEAPVAQGPMFVFPPGSQPLLTVSPGQAGQACALDEQSSASEVIEVEGVRIEEGADDR